MDCRPDFGIRSEPLRGPECPVAGSPCEKIITAMLTVDQIRYSRNGVAIIDGLSLSAAPGTAIQVEGANGSGKTTLLRLLSGLLVPEEGIVNWRGIPIGSPDSSYRNDLAYVGHRNGAKSDLSPRENLAFHMALSGGTLMLEPGEALERVGLGNEADIPCSALSAGQQRRIALARLLVTKADLWLLDEPLANLDTAGCDMLHSMVVKQLSHGMVIMSTHRRVEWPDVGTETLLLHG